MKSGANKIQQEQIKRLAKGDEDNKPLTAKQISTLIQIDEKCVKSFMAKPKPKNG